MNKWPLYKAVGRTWKFEAAKYYNRGKLMRQIKTEQTWKRN
jgi:hypothetical protein